jgi:hypothetical protein
MGSTTTCSRAVTAVAAVTFMCLALAVPAQADDESYLERLRQSQSAIPLPDGALVQGGHIICSHLRRGVEGGCR